MRRLSQVFLRDRTYIDRIISEVSPQPGDLFLEVGPGHGALTRPLLERGASIVAIELDLLLLDRLREELAATSGERFVPVHGNYLRLPIKPLLPRVPVRFISNLPYHISTPALEKMVEEANLYQDAHLMLQKEVAERICAAPGTKQYGYTSVLVRLRYDPAILLHISPMAFSPIPRVISVFVRLNRINEDVQDGVILKAADIARRAFRFRRRTIRNSLRPALRERVDEVLERAGISPEKRADQLLPEEYLEIARTT
ncbi:MAG: 16S rRNA (adenine(1518)-N(6)/adenine(1519)-N(6))-dimethyltransferase RsmA [candidate division WOR-3 bacterium]